MNSRDKDRQTEALVWIEFSKEDLDVASRLISARPSLIRPACWHSQQSAEKAIKAALILESVDFPFVHDLSILRKLLPDGWNVLDTRSELHALTGWAIESRYPGESSKPSPADAIAAESSARSIYDSIVAEFKRRNILS